MDKGKSVESISTTPFIDGGANDEKRVNLFLDGNIFNLSTEQARDLSASLTGSLHMHTKD